MNEVVVGHNASTNQYRKVYHRSSCWVLARTYGEKLMRIETAEALGCTPCCFCHPTSIKLWLCPQCADGTKHERVRMRLAERVGVTCLVCPDCGLTIRQDAEVNHVAG